MTNNLPTIQNAMKNPDIVARINHRLGEKSGTFITSVLDLCGEDNALAACDPNLVIKEALKAAGLNLPINKNLGFAYVIPYKEKGTAKPQFQMGWKGYIQLAIRTGQYKHINAGCVYEGEIICDDRVRGTFKLEGKRTSDKAIGYFCYFELLNGFQKGIAWTKERMTAHAKKYSKSYGKSFSPWKSEPDEMGKKTMVLRLIPKYGVMTIEMSQAMQSDMGDFKGFQGNVETEISENANQETIDIESAALTDEEKAEIEKAEKGPGY